MDEPSGPVRGVFRAFHSAPAPRWCGSRSVPRGRAASLIGRNPLKAIAVTPPAGRDLILGSRCQRLIHQGWSAELMFDVSHLPRGLGGQHMGL